MSEDTGQGCTTAVLTMLGVLLLFVLLAWAGWL